MSALVTSRSDSTPPEIRFSEASRSGSGRPPACASIASSVCSPTVTKVTPHRLAGVRIGLCLLLAYRLTARDYDSFAAHHVHFLPHFYMDLFAHMPSPDVASLLQAFGIAAALVAAFGVALRVTLPVAFACGLILDGILNSAGRVLVRDAL